MGFLDLFVKRARKLTWHRLDDDHVVEEGNGTFKGQSIVKDEDYLVIRMNEMWLVKSRVLWRKCYPMLHGFFSYGPLEAHDVVGPGQLRSLGERNLEKMAAFNHRMAGPIPNRGHELKALVGLYAVPGEDVAKALVDVVGSIAALAGAAPMTGAVVNLVKDSVDKVLGLDGTALQIGVEYTWKATDLKSGYYVGMDADDDHVDVDTLWLNPDRRLLVGPDPNQARAFDATDYMVLALERHTNNPAWGSIPNVAAAEAKIEEVMGGPSTLEEKRQALNRVFPAFQSALSSSTELTTTDATLIGAAVAQKLKDRLAVMGGVDFTTRGAGGGAEAAGLFDAAQEERLRLGKAGVTRADAERRLKEGKF